MAEQLICNQQVVGSTPITSSNEFTQRELLYGRFPEWPKGADCKSVVADFGGPNPPSPTKIEAYPCGMPQITDKAARAAFFLYVFLFPYLRFREQGLFLILQIPVHHRVKQFLQDSSHFTPRGDSECHQVAPVHRKIAQ